MAKDYRYTKDHEWAKAEGEQVRVGISDYAQKELGDVVFVELPDLGRQVKQGEVLLTVESVKAVSEVYSPLSGTVIAVNEALRTTPELINRAPEGDGWILALKPEKPSESEALMKEEDYLAFVSDLSK